MRLGSVGQAGDQRAVWGTERSLEVYRSLTSRDLREGRVLGDQCQGG